MTITVNFTKDDDYHSQRNNSIIPFESCNPTSAIMALKNAGWKVPTRPGEQPEDTLTNVCNSEEGYLYMAESFPWAVGEYKPNEIHGVMEWAINKYMMKEDVDRFSTGWHIKTLLLNLIRGGGATLSTTLTGTGHIVSLAGVVTSQKNFVCCTDEDDIDLKKIEKYIIDDPYGDFRSGYKNHKGNDIELTPEEMRKFCKGEGEKYWAHLISPA